MIVEIHGGSSVLALREEGMKHALRSTPLKHVPARAQASQRGRSGGITSAGSTPGIVRRVPDMWRRIRFESSHSHFMQVGGRAISFDRCYLATRRLCRRAGAQRLRRRPNIHLSRAPCTCQSAAALATVPRWALVNRPLRASDRTGRRVSHPPGPSAMRKP